MQQQRRHDLGYRAPQMRVASEMRVRRPTEVRHEPPRVRQQEREGAGRSDGAPESATLREREPDPQANYRNRRVLPRAERQKDRDRERPGELSLGEVDGRQEQRD